MVGKVMKTLDEELLNQIITILNDCTAATNVSDGKGGVFYDFTFGKALDSLKTLIQKRENRAKYDEWNKFTRAGFDPNKTLAQVLMYANARMNELLAELSKGSK